MAGHLAPIYVALLLTSGAISVGTGVWAVRRTTISERWVFLGLMIGDMCWAVIAAVGIVFTSQWVTIATTYLAAAVGLTVIGAWFVFATLYTGRSLSYRRWQNVVFLGSIGLSIVGLLTNPLHGYYWSTVTYRTEPFTYAVTTSGPAEVVAYLALYGAVLTTLYYLGVLFVKSRHRSSTSLLVLVVGTVLASAPNVVMNLGLAPVSGYDHSPLGIAAFVVFAGYAVFGLGMFDIRPIARDALVDEVDDALVALNADRSLVDYNMASETLLSRDIDGDPIGEPLAVAFPQVADAIEFDGREGRLETDTITIVRDSETRHYAGRLSSVVENGSVAGYSIVLRDVTAREEYRRELERRNRQLDQFGSAVAHDLRNPLQVASGQARLLEQRHLQTVDDEAAVEAVRSIVRSVDRMEAIVTDLRELSEKGQSVDRTESVEFASTVEAAWRTVDTADATLTIASDGIIEAQPSRLQSVLENLLKNAVDHVGPTASVEIGLTPHGFYVADDGPGIDSDDREAVFEYGHTESEDGTGFGLAIVRQMVASHDWQIEATESETGGARFVVTEAETELEDEYQSGPGIRSRVPTARSTGRED